MQTYQSSPIGLSGRPAHCPFRGLLGVHSRCGLHTRAVTNLRHANRRLQPLRYLHDCSDCFRLERLPGGACTHWKAPPLHGARQERSFIDNHHLRSKYFRTGDQGVEPPLDDGNESSDDFRCTPDSGHRRPAQPCPKVPGADVTHYRCTLARTTAFIALYRHYKNGRRPISTFYSVESTQGCYAPVHEIRDGACTVPLHFWHIWRDHMLKAFGAALLLVSALAMTADPPRALQVVVTQVDKNTDLSITYHFTEMTDLGVTLTPGSPKQTGD